MPTIPGPVDSSGNITVPPSGGVIVPVFEQDSDGNPLDIGPLSYRFHVRGRIEKYLIANPDDPTGKLLVLTDDEASQLGSAWVPFAVYDDFNPDVPIPVWIGKIRRGAV